MKIKPAIIAYLYAIKAFAILALCTYSSTDKEGNVKCWEFNAATRCLQPINNH